MFLSLISDQRIQETLKLIGQAPNARLTPAVARDICERTASAAVLDGSIASLGSQYMRGLRATDCRSGKLAPKPRCAKDGRTRPSHVQAIRQQRRSWRTNSIRPPRSTRLFREIGFL
jgi:hypothetical protein